MGWQLRQAERRTLNPTAVGSNPSQPVALLEKAHENGTILSVTDFERKLKLKGLCDKTIETYISCHNIFTRFIKNRNVTTELIENYLLKYRNRRNNLAVMRVLYPDLSKDIKFPRRTFKPKILPNKDQLRIFYENLPFQYKPIFLLLAESGLRVNELLNADFDTVYKMIIPKSHDGQTKHSWISFYRTDFDAITQITVDGLSHAFLRNSKATGIKVYPHLLRSVFAREMSRVGVQDRYIDAFCGRIPQSVLARNYTDYSPEVLKEIYTKANIKILD